MSSPRKLTRKEARRRSVTLVTVLAVVAIVGIVAITLAMNWWSERGQLQPEEVTITVSNGAEEIEVAPYLSCELGTECGEGGDVPVIDPHDADVLTVTIPRAIHDHDWSVVTIYDDPGANDQVFHGPYDTVELELPVTVDPVGDSQERPRLVVVEISSVMLGTNEAGEETAYSTVWSFATEEATEDTGT